MLKQRVITALLLMAVLLPALFASAPWPFMALTLVMIGAAGWEWSRLNHAPGVAALAFGALVVAGAGVAWWLGWVGHSPAGLWWLAMLVWVLGGAWVLRRGVAAWPTVPRGLRLVAGLLLLWLAWLAIAEARLRGLNFLLSTFCLVWAADIAAYFGGRAFGRRKLAPAISPGKSWAGVYSGMIGVLLVAALWMAFDQRGLADGPSLYTLLWQRSGPLGLVIGCLFLSALSVVGDLFESLVKRAVGAKDSSALLPGHGGVLDRIDALLPVCPLALALVCA
ncbi:phosphatidate cytidylyltransferase [Sphaerotilus microaerophilus]|uniref:Phosphatidate cytidylyltransferase n=1 Tax=Sphaerotilus microaerophilus TaxID=2914710 RepID=A0ABN6PS46_9BURK|nr:phosphatidate cytidylyltransferase [Sphaerotilus sp. FB-5]BDI06700.1 phosphatidate cytidylyltransferase [Sphaerotilus sp. FB-5]